MEDFNEVETKVEQVIKAKSSEEFNKLFDELTPFEKMEANRLSSTWNSNVLGWRCERFNDADRDRDLYSVMNDPTYKAAHEEYIKYYNKRQEEKTKVKQKEDRVKYIIAGILIAVIGSILFYFVGIPILKILWLLIAFPMEAMSGINIGGGEEIIKVHPEPSALDLFLGAIGSLMVVGFIIGIVKAIINK